jgi:exopolysaccharide biosynthesis polyprenyl glycosylphosphotransferase
MLRDHWLGLRRTLVAIDAIGGGLTLCLMAWLHAVPLPPWGEGLGRAAVLLLAGCSVWPLALAGLGLYESQRRRSFGGFVGRHVLAGLLAAGALHTTALILGGPLSPDLALATGLVQGGALGALRLGVYGSLRFARRMGRNYRHALIVGTGPRACHVRRVIDRNPGWGFRIVGYVDEEPLPVDPTIPADQVHKLIDVPALLRERVIDEVIVAIPRSMLGALGPLVSECAAAGVPITLLTDLFGDFLPPPRVSRFDTLTTLCFAPIHHSRASLALKRAFDVAGASLGLALAAPVLGVAALAIRLTSNGPVLFRQMRCGLNGRRFEIVKLRTMCANAEQRLDEILHLNEMDGPVFKVKHDPRVTRVGRLLRRYSLDEIPQLLNVVRGDMSLVGPRPPLPHEVSQYESAERRRLSMRPGLTCLWQVSGRNDINFEEWVRLDLEYIDSWSLYQDFKILARTVPAVLFGTGA